MCTNMKLNGLVKIDYMLEEHILKKIMSEVKDKSNTSFSYSHPTEYFYGWLEDDVYAEFEDGNIKSIFRYENIFKGTGITMDEFGDYTSKRNYVVLHDLLSWGKGYGTKAMDEFHNKTKGEDIFLIPYSEELIDYYKKFDYTHIDSSDFAIMLKNN